ncbi:MAG: molecular chaperone [Sphingomonadaceae bacterium]|nr:molecular chaperone [Sphingomonadaceae bacterium]
MKRFYKNVTTEQDDGGWRIALDGRGVKTPARNPQVVPTKVLAGAMAEEWARQGETIDPSAFQLRDLADYAIDAVRETRDALVAELAAYADTDTLCYRGDEGDALHERQLEVWEPLLLAAEQRWDVHFERIGGIIHRPQPKATLTQMAAVLGAQDNFTLAALHMLTSLSASLIIALTAIEPGADAQALWAAASLEEDWQAELWGSDAEAAQTRQARFEAFQFAMRFAELAKA